MPRNLILMHCSVLHSMSQTKDEAVTEPNKFFVIFPTAPTANFRGTLSTVPITTRPNIQYIDSATLQSTQWIINAAYNQRIIQSTPLYTAWINHKIWGQYVCGAPERLPSLGARTFSTIITTSVVQDLNEKISGVDCMMRWLYDALHVS
jgi:hypothetical protein